MNRNIIVALTGPSGVGKTTISDLLIERDLFVLPRHTTTRNARLDDKEGFYRYITHDEFKQKCINDEFLFWSGDSSQISKKFGNYYGILNSDYEIVSDNEKIIIYISYKDIDSIEKLINKGYNIRIVNLIYEDLEKSMSQRLLATNRNHTEDDINKRINCAREYERLYRKKLDSIDVLKIKTDVTDIENTYDKIYQKIIKKR